MIRTGYKIVYRDGDHARSMADPKVSYPLTPGTKLRGPLYLGTSRAYAVDYYSTGTEDPEDMEEMLFTVEYDDRGIIKGNPDEPDQMTGGAEVLVRSATLKKAESLRVQKKESSKMNITDYLDKVASALESRGYVKEAYEIDLIANTLDLMTQVKKPSQDEQMGELNFAAQFVKGKPPQQALQSFIDYWGPDYGPALHKMATYRAQGGNDPRLVPQWGSTVIRAQKAKQLAPKMQADPADDPFMSQADVQKKRQQALQAEVAKNRAESPFARP